MDSIKKKIENTFKEHCKIQSRDTDIGYRSIHIIVKQDNKNIEIQLRTYLQDLWANLCEKYSSSSLDLKYGTRKAEVKNTLKRISQGIKAFEGIEKQNQENIQSFRKNFYKIWFFKKYKNLFIKQKKISRIRKEFNTFMKDEIEIISN